MVQNVSLKRPQKLIQGKPNYGMGLNSRSLVEYPRMDAFQTKEAAIDFAHRQGWEVTEKKELEKSKPFFKIDQVVEPRKKILEFREYGDNFAWNKRLRKPAK